MIGSHHRVRVVALDQVGQAAGVGAGPAVGAVAVVRAAALAAIVGRAAVADHRLAAVGAVQAEAVRGPAVAGGAVFDKLMGTR